jgi:REP element-mobilizing transposase RayT
MTNHYHLLIETPDGNLSKGMRQLNGVYTQRFNRTHGRVGHVFQGRYAYLSGGYSLKQIGEHFGLHYSRVSRIVNQRAGAKSKT